LCLYTDEEHKLGKERLSEMIERSLPSHIYILVRITIIYHNKNALIMLYIICYVFTAEIADFRRINKLGSFFLII